MLSNAGKTLVEAYQGLGQNGPLVFIKLFENFAIITSFLGVGLALFSFNRDLYGLDITKKLLTLVNTITTTYFCDIFCQQFYICFGLC